MNKKKQWKKRIGTLMLIVAFMLPAAVQLIHSFEGHAHIACNKQTTHLHETASKCPVCDFHLATFSYDINEYPNFAAFAISSNIIQQFVSLQLVSFKLTNTQLRAPPHFLS